MLSHIIIPVYNFTNILRVELPPLVLKLIFNLLVSRRRVVQYCKAIASCTIGLRSTPVSKPLAYLLNYSLLLIYTLAKCAVCVVNRFVILSPMVNLRVNHDSFVHIVITIAFKIHDLNIEKDSNKITTL